MLTPYPPGFQENLKQQFITAPEACKHSDGNILQFLGFLRNWTKILSLAVITHICCLNAVLFSYAVVFGSASFLTWEQILKFLIYIYHLCNCLLRALDEGMRSCFSVFSVFHSMWRPTLWTNVICPCIILAQRIYFTVFVYSFACLAYLHQHLAYVNLMRRMR